MSNEQRGSTTQPWPERAVSSRHRRYQLRGKFCAAAALLLLSLLAAKVLTAQAITTGPCAGVETVTRISLDNGGIANWNFQNPRRPYPVLHVRAPVGAVKPADAACFDSVFSSSAGRWQDVEVRFVNETPDRLFEVRFPFKLPALDLGPEGNVCTWTADTPQSAGAQEFGAQNRTLGEQCDEVAARVAAKMQDPDRRDPDLEMVAICEPLWKGSSSGVAPEIRDSRAAASNAIDQARSQPSYCSLLASLIGQPSDPEKFSNSFKSLCKKSTSGYDCTYTLTVSQGGPSVLSPQLLQYLSDPQTDSSGLLTFSVFFVGDGNLPSHNVGYLQVRASFDEPQSSTVWQFTGAVGASTDADFHQRELVFNASGAQEEAYNPFFSLDQPYRGAREDDFQGGANLKLTQKLGNRAEGSATLAFKAGTLGEADQERKVTVSDYSLRLYGDNGTQARFGKYDLASSREKIALVEKGEAVELLWRFASLGAIFKRENVDGPAAKQSEGFRTLVLQLKDLTLAGLPSWRSFNLLAAHGRNEGQPTFKNLILEVPSDPPIPEKITDEERYLAAYTYETVGGDASFTIPGDRNWIVLGNLAAYWSRRKIDEISRKLGGTLPDRIDPTGKIMEGEGQVGLATVIVSKSGGTGAPSPLSYLFQVGYGTGDEAETPHRNEGYVGETTGFVPDKLFLARMASGVRETLVPVGPGLSNKTYVGITLNDNVCRPWLPLVVMARMIGIREQITACNSKLRLHHYELNEKIFANRGNEAGNELNIDFTVTVPKGVSTTLGFGRFRPGSALRDLVKDDPWVLSAGVSVTM